MEEEREEEGGEGGDERCSGVVPIIGHGVKASGEGSNGYTFTTYVAAARAE